MPDLAGGKVLWMLEIDDSKFNSGLGKAKKEIKGIEDTADDADKKANNSFKSILKGGLAIAGIASGIEIVRGAFGMAIGGAATFEQSLNVLRSVTGASSDQMVKLQATARALGNDLSLPGVSAADAAEAMTELGKAGLSVNDVMGASKGVLSLAKAGQLETAQAAEITANALNAFNLEGKQATRVADLLAAAANASSADVTDMAYALQMSAAGAAAIKVPVEDLTTAIAAMANNGIKGSDAGTSLKTMFMNLIPMTDAQHASFKKLNLDFYDAKGNFVGLREMVRQLERGTKDLTDEQKALHLETIFGSDSMRAANILLKEGVSGYDELSKAVNKSGAAAALAAAQNGGFLGALDGLKSTIETIASDIGLKLLPALTDVVNGVSATLPGIVTAVESTFSKVVKRASEFVSQVGAGNFEVIGQVIGKGVARGIQGGIQGLTIGIGAIKSFFESVNFVEVGKFIVTKIIPGIAIGLVAGLGELDIVEDILKPLGDNIGPVLLGVLSVALAPAKLLGPITSIIGKIPIIGPFTNWIINGVRGLVEPIRTAIGGLFRGGVDAGKNIFGTMFNVIKGVIDSIFGYITGIGPGFAVIVRGAFDFAVKAVADSISAIPQFIRSMFDFVGTIISNYTAPFVGVVRFLFGSVVNAVRDTFAPIIARVSSILVDVYRSIADFVGPFVQAGRNIIDGLVRGITNGASAVTNKVVDIAKGSLDAIKKFFGIKSPSRVMMGIGEYMTQGLVIGLQRGQSDVNAAITDLSPALKSTIDTGMVPGSSSSSSTRVTQAPVQVTINPSGIMARSRADLRDIAKDMVESINEELRASGHATAQLGGGYLSGGTANG